MQTGRAIRRQIPADKSAFGFKMLASMGWSEGKGLGKKEDGMASHVRVKRRSEQLGLGSEKGLDGNVHLSGAVQDYNSILKRLAADAVTAAVAGNGKSISASASDSASGRKRSRPTESALPPPAEKHKSERRESSKKDDGKKNRRSSISSSSSSSSSSDSDSEVAPTAVAAAAAGAGSTALTGSRVVSKIRASYHKVARHRNARGYSQADLCAILGTVPKK